MMGAPCASRLAAVLAWKRQCRLPFGWLTPTSVAVSVKVASSMAAP